MPAGISEYGSEAYLAALFGVGPDISEYWIALCTEEPGPGMDGDILDDIEPPQENGYSRVHYNVGPNWWAVESGFTTTTQAVTFPAASDDWGFISHFALLDAQESGNLYAWGEFLNPQYVTAGFGMVIPIGGIVVTMSSLDNSIAP